MQFDGNPFPDIADPRNRELRRLSNLADQRLGVSVPAKDTTKRTKARINHVVNVVLDCFVGPNQENDHILRDLVDRLIVKEPKTAAQLLMRLMPKQIEMEVESNQRTMAALVLVDKTTRPQTPLTAALQHQDEEVYPPIIPQEQQPIVVKSTPVPVSVPTPAAKVSQKPITKVQFPKRPMEEVSPAKAKLVAYLLDKQKSGEISADNPLLQELNGILSSNT